jgi:hypothetical protein
MSSEVTLPANVAVLQTCHFLMRSTAAHRISGSMTLNAQVKREHLILEMTSFELNIVFFCRAMMVYCCCYLIALSLI